MKKLLRLFGVVAVIVLLVVTALGPANAATPEEIEASIAKGLTWLVAQQQPDGSWGAPGEAVAATGLAVLKLEDRAVELGKDPFETDPTKPKYYVYATNVIAGLNYIFGQADYDAVNSKVKWASDGVHYNYMTSIAMMAIASSRTPDRLVSGVPLNNKTYKEVVQYAMNYLVSIQQANGGWGYPWDTWTDNSNAGYAVLGLVYAQSRFGLAIPAAVLTGINNYIGFIQCTTAGDSFGGSGYNTPCDWVNILKTGNLLFQMATVGDTKSTPRAQDAIGYIQNHWNDANQDPGWKWNWPPSQPHLQATFAMMKGFEAMDIKKIMVGMVEVDWFDEVSTAIVSTQNADGSWDYDWWGDQILATEWALLTLEKAVAKPVIAVSLDIKPGSCPNPINLGSLGVLPAAICGTEDFDVTKIDPATIKLVRLAEDGSVIGEVAPIRWSYEDVATPYAGNVECGCHALAGDGYLDLALKFDSRAVDNLKLSLVKGKTVPLVIRGNLMGTEPGKPGPPFQGQDCVRVLAK